MIHNPEVVGSGPTPLQRLIKGITMVVVIPFCLCPIMVNNFLIRIVYDLFVILMVFLFYLFVVWLSDFAPMFVVRK